MPRSGKARAALFAELFFDAAMFLAFIAQTFVLGCLLIYGHIPLPSQWANQAINKQLPEDLSFHASDYNLSLDGTIEINDIVLHADAVRLPIFEAEGAVAELEKGSLYKLKPRLEEFVLSGGRINLPAVYSPSGKDSSILERIAFRLRPGDESLIVDSFAALHNDIRLRGSLALSKPGAKHETSAKEGTMDWLFKQAAFLLKEKSRIEGLKQPTIFFHLESGADRSFNIHSIVSSRELELPQLRAANVSLNARLGLSGNTLVNQSSLLLEADTIELPDYKIRAQSVEALIDRDEWEALLQGEWPDMEIAAHRLKIENIGLESPRIKLQPQSFPEVHFDGTTSGLKGAVRFSGKVNARTRSADIRAAGSVDLLSIASENVSGKLPPMQLEEPPYYQLSLKFSDGFALQSAHLNAEIDDFSLKGTHFDHIRGSGSYQNGIYSIDDLYLRRDWQWLDLTFSLDSATFDYGVSLVGFAKPYDYNDILPRWWASIFRDFSFEEVETGLGDFIIYGNTKKRAADLFFGHVKARKVSFKDVMVDEGELFVRGRGPYAEVHRLDARSGQGFARGDIRFASRLDNVRAPMCIRLDLDTKLPLDDAEKLFDGNVAQIIADFESDALPRTILKGAIFNKAYPEFKNLSYLDLSADCPLPIEYNGVSLDHLSFDLFGRSAITHLRDIKVGYADGEGLAQADVLTAPGQTAEARFTFQLNGADQGKSIAGLSSLQTDADGELPPRDSAASKGVLTMQLNARGPVGNPFMFNGYGNFNIENEALSSIDLFGPLSRLLKDTRLGFTSFALKEMRGEFTLEEEKVRFSQLQINGPRTRIDAPGILNIDDLSLAMRVSVFLFGNAGNPDSNLRKISDLITKPIPNLLEFELTGTADNQKWRSLYDPRKLIPQF